MKFSRSTSAWNCLGSLSLLIPAVLSAPTTKNGFRLLCQAGDISACPDHTLIVSNDSSNALNGNHNNPTFTSIQSAILSLPHDNSSATILVRSGDYTEQLNITRPGPVTLLGETKSPLDASKNQVTVYWSPANETPPFADNAFTSVLTVAPTQNASLTGAGPQGWPVPADTPYGNTNFRVYNIDFRNTFSDHPVNRPMLAVSVSYANAGFYYSGFYSIQDTVRLLLLLLRSEVVFFL